MNYSQFEQPVAKLTLEYETKEHHCTITGDVEITISVQDDYDTYDWENWHDPIRSYQISDIVFNGRFKRNKDGNSYKAVMKPKRLVQHSVSAQVVGKWNRKNIDAAIASLGKPTPGAILDEMPELSAVVMKWEEYK